MKQFERDLHGAGFTGRPVDFYQLVTDAFAQVHPGRTYEWLARDPDLGKDFCERVRHTTGLTLSNRLIMGGLENGRKKAVHASRPVSAK